MSNLFTNCTLIAYLLFTVFYYGEAFAKETQNYKAAATLLPSDDYKYILHFPDNMRLNSFNPELKSKTRARLYSAGYTLLPLILARGFASSYRISDQSVSSSLIISSGLLIGPSAGSIYADDWSLVRRNIFIRSGSAALLVSGYIINGNQNLDDNVAGLLMQIAGGFLLTTNVLYNIIYISAHSVDYYNARIKIEAGLSYYTYLPGSSNYLPGLQVRLIF